MSGMAWAAQLLVMVALLWIVGSVVGGFIWFILRGPRTAWDDKDDAE